MENVGRQAHYTGRHAEQDKCIGCQACWPATNVMVPTIVINVDVPDDHHSSISFRSAG